MDDGLLAEVYERLDAAGLDPDLGAMVLAACEDQLDDAPPMIIVADPITFDPDEWRTWNPPSIPALLSNKGNPTTLPSVKFDHTVYEAVHR